MKIEIFKKKKVWRKGGFHTNPDISWEIIVYVALFMIAASFVAGYYVFIKVDRDFSLPAESVSGQIPTVNKAGLENVLNIFSSRESKSMDIKTLPVPVVDPSL